MSPVIALLDRWVARAGPAPLITYYDDETGERTELSALTLANWVAKTANLLQDGLDVEPGQRMAVRLPPHWQTAAVLLGAWTVGATVTETAAARLLVTSESALGDVLDDALGDALDPADEPEFEQLMGVSLRPLGAPMRLRAAGVTDYAAEVLVYGDDFVPYQPVDPDGVALVAGDLELTARGLADAALALAARMGLMQGDRLLADVGLAAQAGPVAWLLAPLAAGASIVLCRQPRPDQIGHRADTERATVTLGLYVEGLRSAGD